MAQRAWVANGHRWRQARELIRRRVQAGEPCALCGRPIDLDLRDPDPGALHLDHIRPQSKGGDLYDPTNHQPAHRLCNQRKSDGTRKTKRTTTTKTRPTRSSRAW